MADTNTNPPADKPADVNITGFKIVHGDDGGVSLIMLGDDGKLYGLESQFQNMDGDMIDAPINIVQYDENAQPDQNAPADQNVNPTADDAADQPPAASFNQGA